MRKVCGRLVLRLLYVIFFCVRLYVYILVCAYIVAMRLCFTRLQQFGWLLCVATMSSLAQLHVRDRFQEAEAT